MHATYDDLFLVTMAGGAHASEVLLRIFLVPIGDYGDCASSTCRYVRKDKFKIGALET